MTWFSSFRELRRLTESVKYWRGKADEREKEVIRLNTLLLSQSLVFTDKLLVAVNLQPASGQIRAASVSTPKATADIIAEKKVEFMLKKRHECEEEAAEAAEFGKTVDAAAIFTDRMPEFEVEFARMYQTENLRIVN